jgi:hypothetical protein
LQIKTKIVSCHTANSKPVKQEVNSTVILPPLVFPAHVHATLSPSDQSERVREREIGREKEKEGGRERKRERERKRKREGKRERERQRGREREGKRERERCRIWMLHFYF